ncbi:MAG: PPC domain-containing protein [Thermincola sp.]|jgi:hypothetical protein|nr:PPC domain-containing protein [Thermincola sp.]MDT3702137.1 PPC domain-containing protein [Thermincola sp.]
MNLLRKLIVGVTILGLCLSVITVIPATAQASQEVQNELKSTTDDQIIVPMYALTEVESNNSFASANYMREDDYMQASFSSGDVDYFKFYAEATGTYTIYSYGQTDTYGVLFDGSQNFLWDDDDSGDNLNFSITYNLTKDQLYYIKVFHATGGTGSYGILIDYP